MKNPWPLLLAPVPLCAALAACAPAPAGGTATAVPTDTVLPPFEAEIRAFEAADSSGMPPEGAVLFIGSSSLRLWQTLTADMVPLPVVNRGFGGSTMPDLLRYADRILFPYRPRCIVLYEGDNDITHEAITPDSVLANLRSYHQAVRQRLPGSHTWVLSIKPSPARRHLADKARQANDLMQAYCDAVPELTFIDVGAVMRDAGGNLRGDIFLQDSLHLGPSGYALWTDLLRPLLLEHCE
ncbi:MAG: SGNH/GDSL hydrolase family protein [Bacteroidia bacterium]